MAYDGRDMLPLPKDRGGNGEYDAQSRQPADYGSKPYDFSQFIQPCGRHDASPHTHARTSAQRPSFCAGPTSCV